MYARYKIVSSGKRFCLPFVVTYLLMLIQCDYALDNMQLTQLLAASVVSDVNLE